MLTVTVPFCCGILWHNSVNQCYPSTPSAIAIQPYPQLPPSQCPHDSDPSHDQVSFQEYSDEPCSWPALQRRVGSTVPPTGFATTMRHRHTLSSEAANHKESLMSRPFVSANPANPRPMGGGPSPPHHDRSSCPLCPEAAYFPPWLCYRLTVAAA